MLKCVRLALFPPFCACLQRQVNVFWLERAYGEKWAFKSEKTIKKSNIQIWIGRPWQVVFGTGKRSA